jgi:hypothetical protein
MCCTCSSAHKLNRAQQLQAQQLKHQRAAAHKAPAAASSEMHTVNPLFTTLSKGG